MTTVDALRKLVSEFSGQDEELVCSHASPYNLDGWDVINHPYLIAIIEKRFGVRFTLDEINKHDDFGKLSLLLEDKLHIHGSAL